MSGVAIRSVDDLLSFIVLANENDNLWKFIDITTLHVVIPVAVQGEFRDGRIDVFGARFVKDLQRQIHRAVKQYGGISTGGRRNQLRVAVEYGSDSLNVDFTGIIKEVIGKVTPEQLKQILIVGVLCATGYFGITHYIDADLEKSRIDLEKYKAELTVEQQGQLHNHDEKMLELFKKSNAELIGGLRGMAIDVAAADVAQGRDPHQPIRKYTKTIRKKETVSVAGGEKLAKRQALERLVTLPSSETLFYAHADGIYDLLGIDLLDNAQALRIAQGDIKTSGLLERLDAELRGSILKTVEESIDKRKTIDMSLQVDVFFTVNGIHHAVVVGVGSPRSELKNYSLSSFPANINQQDMHIQGM